MNIAIITARGGSKRIPRKNIRPFLGKPMIAWPIEAAKASGCFAHILVSTDDEEIAGISREYGAETPFMRPAELADDFVHADAAVEHALRWALQQWGEIEFFCHLYSTAPGLTAEMICEGHKSLQGGANHANAAFHVNFPVYQILRKAGEGYERLFDQEKALMRSQDMPECYIDAGLMYWSRTGAYLSPEDDLSKLHMVILPPYAAVDIDTEADWLIAEKLHTLFLRKNGSGL
jgi:N-acylneuraminate cytidylyltransferase